jgi:ribosome-associated protein YbcJ (S4-like RNA binding protein)
MCIRDRNRKTAKIRTGQVVSVGTYSIKVN